MKVTENLLLIIKLQDGERDIIRRKNNLLVTITIYIFP